MSTRFLVVGFACSLLLALLTLGLLGFEVTRLEHETLDIADDSHDATYYLGDVGEQLARTRAHVARGLRISSEKLPRQGEIISEIDARLQAAHDALPNALAPELEERWKPLSAEVSRLQRAYAEAFAAIRAGDPARGSALLAREVRAAARVHDELDRLQQAQRDMVLARLRSAHRETSQLNNLELVLAGIFIVAMIAIWALMLRALKRQAQLVADYTTRLEDVNADLDSFAGRVAHDLRNAFGAVALQLPLLDKTADDPSRVRAIAGRMERASRRAVRLVDALLTFSRSSWAVEDGEPASLQTAVREVLEELKPEIDRLGVAVDAEDVPDVQLRCAPGLLHTVLLNLCGNAVKFLDGRDTRRVRIAAHIEDSSCRIEVADSGPGIPKDAREKIFEPFYRVEGARAPGSGIGLATVRRVVEAHGGRVAVESRPGQGALFQVWLSLAPEPSAEPRPAIGESPRQTILLVEDEPASRLAVGELLRSEGYQVLVADRPSQAFEVAEQHPGAIDLLLSDIRLPEISGEQLAASLRESHPSMQVIFMSGMPDPPPGASMFVQKPIELGALIDTVERALARPG